MGGGGGGGGEGGISAVFPITIPLDLKVVRFPFPVWQCTKEASTFMRCRS